MVNSRFSNALQSLREISKSFVQKHKEMLVIFRSIEVKVKPSAHHTEIHKAVLLDFPTFESLLKTCTQLIELDEKSHLSLLSLKDYPLKFELLLKNIQSLNTQQESIKKFISQDLKTFRKSFSDLSSKLNQHLQLKTISKDSLNLKLKSILAPLVYPETIDLYCFKQDIDVPVRLLKTFYKDLPSEEPELELNSKSEAKYQKLAQHTSVLTQSLEKVAETLLGLLLDLAPKSQKPSEDNKFNQSLTNNDLKALMLKISKLHNRGSLTDEEARNMLGKISEIPISPSNQLAELQFEDSGRLEIFVEDVQIEKSRSPMAQSITKEFQKRTTPFRKTSKRVQTPNKKILRNTSLPRASALIKFNPREKPKSLKLKSKSPHSFLYI